MSSLNPAVSELKSQVEVGEDENTLLPVDLPSHLTLRGFNSDPQLLQKSYEIMSHMVETTQSLYNRYYPLTVSPSTQPNEVRSFDKWERTKSIIQSFHTSLFDDPASVDQKSILERYMNLYRAVPYDLGYVTGASNKRVRESKGEDVQAVQDKQTIKDLMTVCTDMSNYLESAAKTDERTMRLLTTACENGKKILEAQRQRSESVDVNSVESVS